MDSETVGQLLDRYMQTQQEVNGFMGSVLVARGEETLLSKGYGKANLEHDIANTPDTKFRIGSISKQFTAAAILKLQDQGLLNVSDTLSVHLPEYPRGEDITLHQVLTHSAGIPSFTGFEDYQTFKKQPATPGETINRFKDLPLEFEPGAQYNYSNSGYVLLTHLIEHIGKKSYADFLNDEFFTPLGLANTGVDEAAIIIPDRAAGYSYDGDYRNADYVDMSIPSGAGNLFSTTRDLHQWILHLRQGRVVQPELFEVMKSPLVVIEQITDTFYGYGLVSVTWKGQQLYGHDGGIDGFVTSAWYDPAIDLSIIAVCNVETCNMTTIAQALSDTVLGRIVELPVMPVAIEVDSSILMHYVGDYELEPNFILSVRLTKNKLMGQATDQDEFELFASSETEFLTTFNAGATFIVEDGAVNGLVWHQGGIDRTARKLSSSN